MAIVALDLKTSKFLTTAQIITSVSTAVKELVENSIDAGANSIDIKLEDNGASLFEVGDNGKGIAKADCAYMALQSYTSKIRDFTDLEALESYGFRGEALASLCAVSDVTIITKTEEDEAARLYRMNRNGNIESSELSHRSVGTTVQARSMFKDIPVRRQILTNTKRSHQDTKVLETFLRSFAICHPKVRINYRVNCNNILTKPATETMRESLTYLFGKKFISQIDFTDKKTPEVDLLLVIPKIDATELLEVCQGGQNVFVNQRPVRYAEIEKIVNNRLVEHFADKIPSRKKLGFFVILNVPPASIDVNLMPNKTAVFLTNLAKVLEILDKMLVDFYGIVETTQEIILDKPTTSNDSTNEYHDCTFTEIKAPSEIKARPSSKKRKLEDRADVDAGSAAKIAAANGEGKTPNRHRRSAKKLFENMANKENQSLNEEVSTAQEPVSQLPVVDLGDDFTEEEISKLLHPEMNQSENGQEIDKDKSRLVEEILDADKNQNEMNAQESDKDKSGSVEEISKAANGLTEKAWSRGQIPINLHGGTDVAIYNYAVKDAANEIEEPESDAKTMGCKGFNKFSRETRPEIIRENPGINFVETAKLLTERWKKLSPEERGYYRDIAAAGQPIKDTSTCSTKSTKRRVSTEHAESNRKRFLNMLENMKNTKSAAKKDNLKMRTVIPWTVDLKSVTRSFISRKSKTPIESKSIVLGGLSENVWLARTGSQIWALSSTQLFDSCKVEKTGTEKTHKKVEEVLGRLLQEEGSLSLIHPVFELA